MTLARIGRQAKTPARHTASCTPPSTTGSVPFAFTLGAAFQFDWSEEGMVIGGIDPGCFRRYPVSMMPRICAP